MLVALDLTARQAARVLEQAVRSRVKLEIDPRPEATGALLWGTLEGREDDIFLVNLYHPGAQAALPHLVGAMCDVRMILSDQLCMFSSFVVDVRDNTVPQRLTLAVPDTIQVANRRRFTRKTPTEPVPVRLSLGPAQGNFVAILCNIGPTGLGCRTTNPELDEALLIGDEVQLEFVLPWAHDVFTVRASVCTKNGTGEEGHMTVGFDFNLAQSDASLESLRAALNDEAARLTEMDSDL